MVTAADIRATRAKLNESQTEFALRFGVDRSTVATWEKGGPPAKGAAKHFLRQVVHQVMGEGGANAGPNMDGSGDKPAT